MPTARFGRLGLEESRMAVRYLGSKMRVLEGLAALIGNPTGGSRRFVDGFSGTGVVAAMAADLGWPVHVNDHLRCARLLSTCRLLSVGDVSYTSLGGYAGAVATLNAVPPVAGFLWREYSPASAVRSPRPRKYFTEENAARLDGMRGWIRTMAEDGKISEAEEGLLLADLLEAASAVANTAGTFGCFLSGWSATSLRKVNVRQRALRIDPVAYSAGEEDVFALQTGVEDTVYFDPPYTKRHYAAYYHLLETLALGDEPEVSGVTGLRPWRNKASPFCYKSQALPSLVDLVKRTDAARIIVSYSSDGHFSLDSLVNALKCLGTVNIHELKPVLRYQPRGRGSALVSEFAVDFRRLGACS